MNILSLRFETVGIPVMLAAVTTFHNDLSGETYV